MGMIMGGWNYRVVVDRRKVAPDAPEDPMWEICEVYYNDDGDPEGWCSASPAGDTLDELRQDLKYMQDAAASGPILEIVWVDGSQLGRKAHGRKEKLVPYVETAEQVAT